MKKLTKITTLALLVLAVCGVSCTKDYDDDISKINSKLATLESLMNKANSDIVSLQSLVTALNAGDYITSVTKLDNDAGYTITFAKQAPITIYNGESKGLSEVNTPIVGVTKDEDGKYYWTITVGSTTGWIKTAEGEKIAATTSAPVMGVDADGCWTLDGTPILDAEGNKVNAVGKDGADGSNGVSGTPFFSNVTVAGGSVLFELANGTVITLPFSPYTIAFEDGTDVLVFPHDGASITFTVILSENLTKADFSAFSAEVKGKAGGDIDVVTRSASTAWQVSVTAPVFSESGNLLTNPQVTVTAPSGTLIGTEPNAILTLSLLGSKGQTTTVSRALRVSGIAIIRNGVRMQGYYDLKDAVAQTQAGDIVELSEGQYPLTVDPALAAINMDWYLPVETENLTIRGVGNVVIYGETETPSTTAATQNLIEVTASGFRLENVTVMSKPGLQHDNLIRVLVGGDLLLKGCTFALNSIVPVPENLCGSTVNLWPRNAATGSFLIENCTFNRIQLFLDDCQQGVSVTVKGCTFIGHRLYSHSGVSYPTPSIATRTFFSTDPVGATVNIQRCTFTDVVPPPKNVNDGGAGAISAAIGVFNLSDNTFPTNGCYWIASGNTVINIAPVAQWQVGSFWMEDRSEPENWTDDGQTIRFWNATPTPNGDFYKYYGKFSIVGMAAADYWKVEAQLYVNPAETGTKMRKSMWVNVQDANRAEVDWSVVEYSTDGGTPVWRVFNSTQGWVDLTSVAANYSAAGYHTLAVAYEGEGTMKVYIDGTEAYSYTSGELTTAKSLVRSVTLQSYDTGEVYSSYWKHPVVSGR